jgi:hypothetical protein
MGIGVGHAVGMEIIVDIHVGQDGRPTGSVRASGSTEVRTFAGNLEFIALVESLYQVSDSSISNSETSKKGQENV